MIRPPAGQRRPTAGPTPPLGVDALHHRLLHLDPTDRLPKLTEQRLKELVSLAADGLLERFSTVHRRGQFRRGFSSRPDGRIIGMLGSEVVDWRRQILGMVGVHHLQDRLPQARLGGRPGKRPSRVGQTSTPTTILPTRFTSLTGHGCPERLGWQWSTKIPERKSGVEAVSGC